MTEQYPNAHYFDAPFCARTFDIARGFAQESTFGDYVQSGGIRDPKPFRIQPGHAIIRFFDSTKSTEVSRREWCGSWWIEQKTLVELFKFACQRKWNLRDTASRLLFVPDYWGDMGSFVKLSPRTVWQGLRGFGKWPSNRTPKPKEPNHGFSSPRDYEAHAVEDKYYGYAPTGGAGVPSALQLYIPGTAEELSNLLWIRTGRVTELEQELRRL